MLCHPIKTKQLSGFKEFAQLDWRRQGAKRFKEKGLYRVPTICGVKCHYWNDCKEEIKSYGKEE